MYITSYSTHNSSQHIHVHVRTLLYTCDLLFDVHVH